MFTYWYCATVYTSYPAGQEAAYVAACRFSGALKKLGLPIYCPIAETHGQAIYGDIDKLDHDFWMYADRPLLDAASGLIVVKMEGWEVSRGIAVEIRAHDKSGKPIVYWDPACAIPLDEIRGHMIRQNIRIARRAA